MYILYIIIQLLNKSIVITIFEEKDQNERPGLINFFSFIKLLNMIYNTKKIIIMRFSRLSDIAFYIVKDKLVYYIIEGVQNRKFYKSIYNARYKFTVIVYFYKPYMYVLYKQKCAFKQSIKYLIKYFLKYPSEIVKVYMYIRVCLLTNVNQLPYFCT